MQSIQSTLTSARSYPVAFLIIAILFTYVIIQFGFGKTVDVTPERPHAAPESFSAHVLLDMRDISLENGSAGWLRSRISAEHMSLERKRLGFLRVGGLRQMRLSGVSLDVHLSESELPADFPDNETDALRRHAPDKDHGQSMPLLPEWRRGLTEIIADSVSIRVHQNERVISSVRCGRLVADSSSPLLRLEDGVEITQGDDSNVASTALLEPDRLIVRIPGREAVDLTGGSQTHSADGVMHTYPRGG